MVTAKVTHTIYVLVSGFFVFSILSSILSVVNGKIFIRTTQAMRRMTMTKGTITIIHSPKPTP